MALLAYRQRLRGGTDRGWGVGATNLREGTLGEDTVEVVSRCPAREQCGWQWCYSHEQAGLSAGTVTDNDQLATDLSHLREGSMGRLSNE